MRERFDFHSWMRSTHAVFLGIAVLSAGVWIVLTVFSSRIFPVFAAEDFRTQMIKITLPAGSASATAVAPVDFTPVVPSRTIVLLSGVTQHAMGDVFNGGQTPEDASVRVELTSGSHITVTRASAPARRANEVWVQLIEYTGESGGANEFIVRDRRVHIWNDGETATSYGPIGTVLDSNKAVVFNSGVTNPNNNLSYFARGDVRSEINAGLSVQLTRGDGVGAILSSHQVVEFTGANWKIQQGNVVPLPGPGGMDVALATVGDPSKAWVYFTWDTDSGNVDERGHRLFLTSPTNLRAQEHPTATANKTIHWYVISNPGMYVQTGQADGQFMNNLTASISGFVPVHDALRSFAWVTGTTDGGGGSHPQDMWQFSLSGTSTIELERGRFGASLNYQYFVIELPSSTTSNGDGKGGGFIRSLPSNRSLLINNGDICVPSREVHLTIGADYAVDVLISSDQYFRLAQWEPFVSPMEKTWMLPEGDGEKTVYVMFRSESADLSTPVYQHIYLDEEGKCGVVEEPSPEPEPIPEPEVPPAEPIVPEPEPEPLPEPEPPLEPEPEAPVCHGTVFTRFMIIGDEDTQVRDLQILLQCLGYFPSSIQPTAIFGPITEQAVRSFQSAHGIEPVGYVGPATRAALNGYAP